MKKNIYLIAFVLFSTASVFGQIDSERTLRNNSSKSTRRSSRSFENVENTYAFKFDPLKMFIGELSFSLEAKIADKSTIEVELGPTISNLKNGINLNSHVYDSYGSNVDGSLMGGFGSIAYRFYPLENATAFNRFYVSPKLKFRNYNYNYADNVYMTLPDQQGKSSEFIFSFNLGTQIWYSSNFAIDYYCGLGMGSVNSTRYNVISTYDGNTGIYTSSWDKTTEKYARVVGVIGLKITVGN